ncbi:putative F-box/LRR-repeat protein At5g41840 [Rosa chinensis]|uniref:putative F-box/LRR-repeat protein At5g41840 n=1 Tax=Rosa chinensis TaxID=74649 RepID=UPI001AD905DA|nr:putative F-box/LRR-repeat protein At5g41840 [Rosa chinensis]
MALNKVHPHIPNLVIQQIIRLLPTKAAVRMSFLSRQWEEVLSSVPILDFNECGEQPHNSDRNDFQQQHRKFINNILKRYLERCDKNQHKQLLEKFRLHMMYLSEDTAIVDRLLSFSFERGVKELEISLRVSKSHWARGGVNSYYCFCLSPSTLANAKSITTLKLEYMRIKEVDLQCDMNLPKSTTLLPSLKTMHVPQERALQLSLLLDSRVPFHRAFVIDRSHVLLTNL